MMRQSLADVKAAQQCQKLPPPGFRVLTLSRLDICSIRQIPLDADNNIFEAGENYGGQNIIGDALFKEDRRVGREFWVCGECCGKGRSVVVPLGVRDYVSGPSQSKRRRRYSRDEM